MEKAIEIIRYALNRGEIYNKYGDHYKVIQIGDRIKIIKNNSETHFINVDYINGEQKDIIIPEYAEKFWSDLLICDPKITKKEAIDLCIMDICKIIEVVSKLNHNIFTIMLNDELCVHIPGTNGYFLPLKSESHKLLYDTNEGVFSIHIEKGRGHSLEFLNSISEGLRDLLVVYQ